jgi:hypothetical protein
MSDKGLAVLSSVDCNNFFLFLWKPAFYPPSYRSQQPQSFPGAGYFDSGQQQQQQQQFQQQQQQFQQQQQQFQQQAAQHYPSQLHQHRNDHSPLFQLRSQYQSYYFSMYDRYVIYMYVPVLYNTVPVPFLHQRSIIFLGLLVTGQQRKDLQYCTDLLATAMYPYDNWFLAERTNDVFKVLLSVPW